MRTTEDQTVAAGHSLDVDPARWQAGLEELLGRAVWDNDPGHQDAHPHAGRWCAGRLVTGDEVYGADPKLRAELEARGLGYVLAVACDHRVVAAGDTWRADALARQVPARARQWVSAGRGAKGHRLFDWAFIRLDDGDPSPGGLGQRWLLVRRNPKTGELAFYYCWTPRPVSLAALVRVAGRRWAIEERSRPARGLCGLDQHQVRRWRSWYRWTTWPWLPTPSWWWLPVLNGPATRHLPG